MSSSLEGQGFATRLLDQQPNPGQHQPRSSSHSNRDSSSFRSGSLMEGSVIPGTELDSIVSTLRNSLSMSRNTTPKIEASESDNMIIMKNNNENDNSNDNRNSSSSRLSSSIKEKVVLDPSYKNDNNNNNNSSSASLTPQEESRKQMLDFCLKTFIYRVLIDFLYTLILSYIVFRKLTGSLLYAFINLFTGIIVYFSFINVYEREIKTWIKCTILVVWLVFAIAFITIVAVE